MSFGISVGDFIAIAQLTNKIRKDFVGAPSQLKTISDELRALSIVIQDVDTNLEGYDLTAEQDCSLKDIADNCRQLLGDLEKTVQKYSKIERCDGGSLRRNIKRTWKRLEWKPEDVRELRDRITSNTTLLNTFLGGINSQAIIAAKEGVERLHERQDDEDKQVILNWLTPIDHTAQQHHYFHTKRQAGTGQWFLESEEYCLWVGTAGRTLFCPGIPGAGKTILTSIITDSLMTRFGNDEGVTIVCLYYNYQQQEEQRLSVLMASMLKQVIQQQSVLPGEVATLHEKHKRRGTHPAAEELTSVARSVISGYSRVFIVVDALDECQPSERGNFLSTIFELQNDLELNLLVTSRFIKEITNRFSGCLYREIRASYKDVENYLHNHISDLPGFVQRNSNLQHEIISAIIQVVDGMFLLAQLHIESLRGKRSAKAIRTTLQNLAAGIDAYTQAYDEAMERIECQLPDQRELAKQVLAWIVYAKRALWMNEIQTALGVEIGESELDTENLPDIDDLLSVCAGLVTVDDNKITLVHYTTQQYFQQTKSRWFPEAEDQITRVCLTYLSFDGFDSPVYKIYNSPLYKYVVLHWGTHARQAVSVSDEVMNFLQSSKNVPLAWEALLRSSDPSWLGRLIHDNWVDPLADKLHHGSDQYNTRNPVALHLAAYFGLDKLVGMLIDRKYCTELMDSRGRTPLSYAAANGHVSTVHLLLEKGADINSKRHKGSRDGPLLLAIYGGHEKVIDLLLDKDADIMEVLWYPWSHFSKVIHHDAETVQLFIENNLLLENNLLALGHLYLKRHVSHNGHVMLKDVCFSKSSLRKNNSLLKTLLLEKKSSPKTKLKGINTTLTTGGWTPLITAAYSGSLAGVDKLLDLGVDVNRRDSEGRTALFHAVAEGHTPIAELILSRHDADSDAKDEYNCTAFSQACASNNPVIAGMLCADKRIDVDMPHPKFGTTPLLRAVKSGHTDIVRLLLSTQRVMINRQDRAGWTPLWYSIFFNHSEVEVLLREALEKSDIPIRENDIPIRKIPKGYHTDRLRQVTQKLHWPS